MQSKKKPATPDVFTNNYGYDDDRGDYLVNHDHLAHRYEIIDTLGKGSFGQLLNCHDHSTGESVAIKIICNKKRFHLVEIKILDNLCKRVSWLLLLSLSTMFTGCRRKSCYQNDGSFLLPKPSLHRELSNLIRLKVNIFRSALILAYRLSTRSCHLLANRI